MPKLSKTKSFTVSKETIEVDFKGAKRECANLLKSGITNQTIVLVAHENVWNEVNVLNLGGDDSNLQAFKNFIESMNLGLVDLGITTEKQQGNYELVHQDFMDLQEKFPDHDYIQISILNDYNVKSGGKASKYELIEWLKVCQRDKISIKELIENREVEKQKNINEKLPEMSIENFDEPIELEVGENNQTMIPVETVVIPEVIPEPATMPTTNVSVATNNVPAPTKKPISLQVFETLTPERISELQGLNERQIQIVKENPVVKITDKTSYEAAKKTAAILLKASTAIDGSTGIEATATKYLNTFKSMLKNALAPIALITRKPYDEQKTLISAWENAEELRIQAEQRAKLEKIKKRTDELFAVPFVFNGSVYSIGTVYVVGSQIENLSDEDFAIIVNNGKIIKQQLDAEAEAQKGKDAEIAALKAQLAAFMALQNMSNTDTEQPATVSENSATGTPAQPATELKTDPTDQVANFMNPEHGTKPVASYNLPAENNKLLNALDLKNAEHLEKPAYIKCRGYYVQGLIDVANEIEFILNDATPNPVKKSERISNLCAILKNSK